jgi:hypothetical protein
MVRAVRAAALAVNVPRVIPVAHSAAAHNLTDLREHGCRGRS